MLYLKKKNIAAVLRPHRRRSLKASQEEERRLTMLY
jgi:hypothetical protein